PARGPWGGGPRPGPPPHRLAPRPLRLPVAGDVLADPGDAGQQSAQILLGRGRGCCCEQGKGQQGGSQANGFTHGAPAIPVENGPFLLGLAGPPAVPHAPESYTHAN